MQRIVTDRVPRVVKDCVGRTTGARLGKRLRRRVLISEFGGERDTPTFLVALALMPRSSIIHFPEGMWADNKGIAVKPKKTVVCASATIMDISNPALDQGIFHIDTPSFRGDHESNSMIVAEILEAVTGLGISAIEGEFQRPPITPELLDKQTRQIIELFERWGIQYGFLSEKLDQARWSFWMGPQELSQRRWQRFLLNSS